MYMNTKEEEGTISQLLSTKLVDMSVCLYVCIYAFYSCVKNYARHHTYKRVWDLKLASVR